MRVKTRLLAVALIVLTFAAVAMPAASAAEPKTVLNYSIKDARAFLTQIHYPQSTFVSEKYGPCQAQDGPPTAGIIPDEGDTYECDRTRYNQEPGSCKDQALGKTEEAPETPSPSELEGGVGPTDVGDEPTDFPVGNPVTVIHGLSLGRLGSSPEAGGLASMYYVDNSGRRETEAHVESDGYVTNRNEYEERCAVVDAASESGMYPGPFAAHMLSRSTQMPSTYNMASFTTAEARTLPPGQPKESVTIVKLWEANGKVHGLLSATVRALTLADQIKVDLVRSIISFSSDGTEKGLEALAKTEAFGITIAGTKIASLSANQVIPLGDNSYLGVVRPVVETSGDGHRLVVRAPGLFLAARTTLNEIPIPEQPDLPPGFEPLEEEITFGGRLYPDQVVYVAGALLDAGMGRIQEFSLGPLPPLPPLPGFTPFRPGTITPPTFGTEPVVPPAQPVGQPRYVTRELAGSAWTLVALITFTFLGLLGVMGRWATRFPWAQRVAHIPPFPALGWAYRAFLKG